MIGYFIWKKSKATAQVISASHAHAPVVEMQQQNILIEDKANGSPIIEVARGKYPGVVPVEPEGDKVTRASVVSPLIEAGLVWLPEEAEWLLDYEMEVGRFPLSSFKDQVDSTSQALRWIRDNAVRGMKIFSSGERRVGTGTDRPAATSGSELDWGSMGSTDTSGFIV